MIRRLADDPTLTRNSQILALLNMLRDEFHYAWNYAEMGCIFNVNKGIVHRIRSQAMPEVRHNVGRLPIMQSDQEAEVIACTTGRFQDCSSPPPEVSLPVCLRNVQKGSLVFMGVSARMT
jgi:hypothetical protein